MASTDVNENTEVAIKNGQSGNRGNIGHKTHNEYRENYKHNT
jgi:hypothetical protein